MVHWTLGVWYRDKGPCLEERFDGSNRTEITGATMNPGSFEFSLLESLKSPRVESMNGEEHCNCLYFSHGYYPNHDAKGNVLEVTLDCYADVQNPNYFNIIPMDVLSKKMSADNTITKKIFNRINSESKHRFSYQTLKLIA